MTTPTLAEFLLARLDEDEKFFATYSVEEEHRAFLLADVEAKRRIVERCADALRFLNPDGHWAIDGTLRDLATVYADHSDFDESWRTSILGASVSEQTTTPTLTDAERETLAAIVRGHRFGRGTGGSATGSRCVCSCGEENYINSTRDMAERRAERHVADAILASDWLAARVAEAVDRERAAWATKIEALADAWDDFEHDLATCPKYVCPDCTMKNAVYDLRELLSAGDTEAKP